MRGRDRDSKRGIGIVRDGGRHKERERERE